MIDSIIKNKLTETKLITAQNRRKEIRKYLDYYSATSTDQYIKNKINNNKEGMELHHLLTIKENN